MQDYIDSSFFNTLKQNISLFKIIPFKILKSLESFFIKEKNCFATVNYYSPEVSL